ncbi:MAG: hypothetical protein WKF83_14770 [Nocardioidaceae bacterium]
MYESLLLEHTSTVDRAAEVLRHALFAGDLAPGTPCAKSRSPISSASDAVRSERRSAPSPLRAWSPGSPTAA